MISHRPQSDTQLTTRCRILVAPVAAVVPPVARARRTDAAPVGAREVPAAVGAARLGRLVTGGGHTHMTSA